MLYRFNKKEKNDYHLKVTTMNPPHQQYIELKFRMCLVVSKLSILNFIHVPISP